MPSSNIDSRAETQHFLQKKHKLFICEILLYHKISCLGFNFGFPISCDDRSNEGFLLPSSFQARVSCSVICKLIQTRIFLSNGFPLHVSHLLRRRPSFSSSCRPGLRKPDRSRWGNSNMVTLNVFKVLMLMFIATSETFTCIIFLKCKNQALQTVVSDHAVNGQWQHNSINN